MDALLIALAIEPGQKHFDPGSCPSINLVLDICAGLLIFDEQSEVVRLVHYTLQDYFNDRGKITYTDVHRSIARICMSYLDFGFVLDHANEIEERFRNGGMAVQESCSSGARYGKISVRSSCSYFV